MPQSLDDLPNELLEQITSYSELWEKRPPPSSSIFGVLSRLNRRLRKFALPHLFATLHLPLTDISFAVPTISAGPFSRLMALIRSDPIYKNSIRELIVGHKFYPFFELFHIGSVNASLSASRYAWEVFGAERPSPWLNLESFACLDMSCGPATIEALQSCTNLRSLTLAWDDTTYPDLDGFPNLESLRLAGKAISWDTRENPPRTASGLASPCSSLRTLALHGGVALPDDLTENLHRLYPHLRVLVADKTWLTPADVLHMVSQHAGLEEVNADFHRQHTLRLENVVDVAIGRIQSWSRTQDAKMDVTHCFRTRHTMWTRLMAQSFAFVRERKINLVESQSERPFFDITSFAFTIHGNDDGVPFDELTAFFDRPAEFPFQHIRHLTFSIGPQENYSFPEQQFVDDFMEHMADLLSNWMALETFTFHFDLQGRRWQATNPEGYVPLLDDTTVPTEQAGEEEPTLRHILHHVPPFAALKVIGEVSWVLGRDVGIDDDSIELDLIWLDRNEHFVYKGVRVLAEKCRKLRAFRWFVDLTSDTPSTQWAYEIARDKDGKVQDVQVQTSCLMSRKETLLEFEVLVGQELQTVAEAWPARHDEYIW